MFPRLLLLGFCSAFIVTGMASSLAVSTSAVSTSIASTSDMCDSSRFHTDGIVILGQKKHSSYDSTRNSSFHPVLLSLEANYKAAKEADVMVWHEGDLGRQDLPNQPLSFHVTFCNLKHDQAAAAWGLPSFAGNDSFSMPLYSLGYRFMIRLFAVTGWRFFSSLGYHYMLRLDDDSQILSPIAYNLFDAMRENNRTYGYRSLALECGSSQFEVLVNKFAADEGIPMPGGTYCRSAGQYGFYNNLFISRLDWWLGPRVQAFLRRADESMLIFTTRQGDIAWQTAAVRLLLPPSQRMHFVDFTYLHATVRHRLVDYGGIEVGTNDANATTNVFNYIYFNSNNYIVKNKGISTCVVLDGWGGYNKSAPPPTASPPSHTVKLVAAGIFDAQRTKYRLAAPACFDPELVDPVALDARVTNTTLHGKILHLHPAAPNSSSSSSSSSFLLHLGILHRLPPGPVPWYLAPRPAAAVSASELEPFYVSPKTFPPVTLGGVVREVDTKPVYFVTNTTLRRVVSGQELTEHGLSFDDVVVVTATHLGLLRDRSM